MVNEQDSQSSTKYKYVHLLKASFSKYGLWWIFLALMVFAIILSPKFATYRNIMNVLRQVSILGVLAVGMTYVILTGGIDLSVGGIMALSCVLVPVISPFVGNSIALIILVCILVGVCLGTATGVLVSYARMQPFIVTLGMSAVAEGIAFILSNGRPIILSDMRWSDFGKGFTVGFPNLALVFLLIVIIGQLVISKSVFGVYIYAIGNNEEALRLSGVRTQFIKTFAYLISGMLAAIGGLMMTARIGVGDPGVGSGYSLDVIAAVVVGGTRMGGGYGSVANTLLGAAIMGVLSNIFNLIGLSPYPQMVFKGLIIITAVLFEQLRKNRE